MNNGSISICMGNKREPFFPNTTYHIWNHAIEPTNIFCNKENYRYFLERYAHYINPIADTFAYCLMPNHFHILLQIKGDVELRDFFFPEEKESLSDSTLSRQISMQFGKFFNAYVKAYNKSYERKGPLFWQELYRRSVETEEYFRNLVHYIHHNPVHHGFVDDFRDWEHSSYASFLSPKMSKLKRQEVLKWYGDIDEFVIFHQKEIEERVAIQFDDL